VTATDLYIHGFGGSVMDNLICGEQIMIGAGSCGPSAYPHRPTDINGDYAFDVCLPPKPSSNAVLTMSMENGPNNSIATDPVLTPQPAAGACAGPQDIRGLGVPADRPQAHHGEAHARRAPRFPGLPG
jgi:hypothetical protein